MRELLSVSETEGENNQTRDVFYNSLSLRLLLRKIHLPRQREAKSHLTIFYFHRLTFFEPRDYRVDFIYIKPLSQDRERGFALTQKALEIVNLLLTGFVIKV